MSSAPRKAAYLGLRQGGDGSLGLALGVAMGVLQLLTLLLLLWMLQSL